MPHITGRTVIPSGFHQVIVSVTSADLPRGPASFSFGTEGAGGDTISAVNTWLTHDTAGLEARMYSQYTVVGFDLLTETTLDPQVINNPGTASAANLMPPNVCALINEKTGERGKRNRGRMYWPGVLAEADVDNAGAIDPTTIENLQETAEFLQTALDSNDCTLVILHRYTWPTGDPDPGPPAGFPDPTPVATIVASGTAATQRRRLR